MAYLKKDIYIGSVSTPIYHFTNRSISEGTARGVFAVDVIGNELSVDTFTVTIKHRFDADLIYAPIGKDGYIDTNGKVYRLKKDGIAQYFNFVPAGSNSLIDINDQIFRVFAGYVAGEYFAVPYGTPVYWYISDSFFAKGYLKSVDRVGKYAWKLTCISGIGLLDSQMHQGGIYRGATLISVARSIVNGAFEFNASSDTGSTPVYGHLPYDKARNNLHRLLFANGASIVKSSASRDYTIRWLDEAAKDVGTNRIALGGSVDYKLPANAVEVTEHSFFNSGNDEIVELYNTENKEVSQQLVVFEQSPVHDLTTTGTLVVNSSNVNYAIVTGNGTLSGRLYTHTQNIVRISERKPGDQERVVRVTDNELVSSLNSKNVAARVLNYYSSAKTVKAKIMLNTESCGNLLSTVDAFGEETNALLSKMDVVPTTVKGATVELISNYTPGNFGNNYNNRVMITESGTWQVPAGITNIRIVLIGGGQGGQGGYDGKPGLGTTGETSGHLHLDEVWMEGAEEPAWSYLHYVGEQPPQSGGSAGVGGKQGLVFEQDIDVTPGSTVALTIGAGGVGGAVNGGDGADGGNTTVVIGSSTYSSAAGVDHNYYDQIAKTTYARNGVNGMKGGRGGTAGGANGLYNGYDGADGLDGGNVGTNTGGAGGAGTGTSGIVYPDIGIGRMIGKKYFACGSGGGGAAFGHNGSPGGTYTTEVVYRDGVVRGYKITGAVGGDGADADAPADQTVYGSGGRGGNGGGAGGNASGVQCLAPAFVEPEAPYYYTPGGIVGTENARASSGGRGSVGGKGGNGCAIILY